MPRGKKSTAEQINGKLREVEAGPAQRKTVPEVVRKLGGTNCWTGRLDPRAIDQRRPAIRTMIRSATRPEPPPFMIWASLVMKSR
jgi:hypothetical protein